MALRSALVMNVKVIAIAHNQAHAKLLKSITHEWVVDQIMEANALMSPQDLQQKLEDLKPDRLRAWEDKKKREAPGWIPTAAEVKRQRKLPIDEMLLTTMTSRTPTRATAAAPTASPAAPAPSTPARTPTPTSDAAASSEMPQESPNLQELLRTWG
jgi:hypothetical protein